MPDTVDDFMRRFGANTTVDDREAAAYHERFVSPKEDDKEFDKSTYNESATEYLGKLPDDQFQQAARSAVSQVPPQERQGLLGHLMAALEGTGGTGAAGGLAKTLGLGTDDPSRMSDDDAARLMNYARTQQPEALRKTVEEKPWIVKAMGNPVVMGALAVAAAKLLSKQRRKSGGGGLF